MASLSNHEIKLTHVQLFAALKLAGSRRIVRFLVRQPSLRT